MNTSIKIGSSISIEKTVLLIANTVLSCWGTEPRLNQLLESADICSYQLINGLVHSAQNWSFPTLSPVSYDFTSLNISKMANYSQYLKIPTKTKKKSWHASHQIRFRFEVWTKMRRMKFTHQKQIQIFQKKKNDDIKEKSRQKSVPFVLFFIIFFSFIN